MTQPLSDRERFHLNSAIAKIGPLRPAGRWKVELWWHEADAIYKEFCRLANYATLLGEPSPAEMAGIFTREESEERAEAFFRGEIKAGDIA